MNGDGCEHGVEGFCMQCVREGEGKGGGPQPRYCAFGRQPRACPPSRVISDGSGHTSELCYRYADRGNAYCTEKHAHLEGSPEDVYARAVTAIANRIRTWADDIWESIDGRPGEMGQRAAVQTLRDAADSVERGDATPPWAR